MTRRFYEAKPKNYAECKAVRNTIKAMALKPAIVRCSESRLELIVGGRAAELLHHEGLEEKFGLKPYLPEPGDPVVKILQEEFYAAHISSERLIRENPHAGMCLARYSALLVKLSETPKPEVIEYILNLMEEGSCTDIVDTKCARRLAAESRMGAIVSGEKAAACIRTLED